MKCLDSVYKSKAALQACVVEPDIAEKMRKDHKAELRTTILNDQIWTQLEDARTLLRPFLTVILDLEKDTPRLSWVYRRYNELQTHAKSAFVCGLPIGDQVTKIVDERWNWLRRPVNVGCISFGSPNGLIRTPRRDSGRIWEILGRILWPSRFSAYVFTNMRVGFTPGAFESGILWRSAPHTSPITWWKANFQYSCPELTKLAIRVLSMPASAACSERNWSAFNFIHSASRNRLLNHKVQKLVNIYWNSRLLIDVQDDGTYFDEDMEAEGI